MAIAALSTPASAAAATLAHTVPAGTDRMLVASFGHEVSGRITVDSVDYGGQAMVEAVQSDTIDTGFSAGCSIWYLLEAGIDAASTNVITPTYSAAPADEEIHAAAYENVNQTGGATTNPATAEAETNESTPNPLILDLTETDEGMVAAVGCNGSANAYTWAAAMTERTDQADASSQSSYADRLSTTGANVDIEPSVGGTQNRAAGCSASFAQAAAATHEQDGFRFEEDDGTESGSTFIAAQNTNITRGKEAAFRVRQGGQLVGDPAGLSATEQYKESGDAAAEWRDIP